MAGSPVFSGVLTKEYLESEYVTKKRSAPNIAKEAGCTPPTVLRHLRLHGLKPRPRLMRGDLTGQRFAHFVAVSRIPGKRTRPTCWLCRCDCGKEKIVPIKGLFSGQTKSCGCRLRGKFSRNYKGTLNISKAYWNAVGRSARDRKHEFTVTITEAEELFVRQGGKCALSGIPLNPCENGFSSGNWTASLDRRDSRRGYVLDNVQWVHKDVNRMKWHYDEDYFIELCRAITNHSYGSDD